MGARHHFKIDATPHGNHSTIEMDGEPLTGVQAVRVDTAVGTATTITVTFVNVTVEYTCPDLATDD